MATGDPPEEDRIRFRRYRNITRTEDYQRLMDVYREQTEASIRQARMETDRYRAEMERYRAQAESYVNSSNSYTYTTSVPTISIDPISIDHYTYTNEIPTAPTIEPINVQDYVVVTPPPPTFSPEFISRWILERFERENNGMVRKDIPDPAVDTFGIFNRKMIR